SEHLSCSIDAAAGLQNHAAFAVTTTAVTSVVRGMITTNAAITVVVVVAVIIWCLRQLNLAPCPLRENIGGLPWVEVNLVRAAAHDNKISKHRPHVAGAQVGDLTAAHRYCLRERLSTEAVETQRNCLREIPCLGPSVDSAGDEVPHS